MVRKKNKFIYVLTTDLDIAVDENGVLGRFSTMKKAVKAKKEFLKEAKGFTGDIKSRDFVINKQQID